MLHWLRRRFIAGFFVTVPLIISVAALIWIFDVIDGVMGPVYTRLLGREVPGLGLLTTAALVLGVGTLTTNVIGQRLLGLVESWLVRIPVFSTIYSPVKQLLAAFAPESTGGLKRVVLVEDKNGRAALGFLTKEFIVNRGNGPERMIAVYVPTNHLYLGDVQIFPASAAAYPDLTVEEGVKVLLTGGMSMAARVQLRSLATPPEART
ncbi:MAG: DUF502 domain-containing protein [Bacteroidales bacterium]